MNVEKVVVDEESGIGVVEGWREREQPRHNHVLHAPCPEPLSDAVTRGTGSFPRLPDWQSKFLCRKHSAIPHDAFTVTHVGTIWNLFVTLRKLKIDNFYLGLNYIVSYNFVFGLFFFYICFWINFRERQNSGSFWFFLKFILLSFFFL